MFAQFRSVVNRYLDHIVYPEFPTFFGPCSAFQFWGYIGFILGTLLAIYLAKFQLLIIWVVMGIAIVAIFTLFGLVMITKILTGKELLTNYHHQITVLLLIALLLKFLNLPILPYLDVSVLGIGVFITCGRIGCLMVGCCHGRPYSWGVRYRYEHAEAGFNIHYVGARFFPIQVIESLWVLGLVVIGIGFILSNQQSGTALTWYVVMYSCGRFYFEFMRGDSNRRYFLEFSETQWLSLILVLIIILVGVADYVPIKPWHIVIIFALIVTIITLKLSGIYKNTQHQLLQPDHLQEIAAVLDLLAALATRDGIVSRKESLPNDIHIGCTTLGFQISANLIQSEKYLIYQYTFSSKKECLTENIAKALAYLIVCLKHPSSTSKIIGGEMGIYHLVVSQNQRLQSL